MLIERGLFYLGRLTMKVKKMQWQKINVIWWGILVGLVVGLIVGAFRALVKLIFMGLTFLYRQGLINAKALCLVLFLNLLMAFIIRALMKDETSIQGSGIPQVEGQLINHLHYPWWSVLWHKFIASTLTVGSGIFMGHEGPSIQLGGSAAQGVGVLTHQDSKHQRLMIAAGAAAGLTTVFNTPLASCLFIIESVYHRFTLSIFLETLGASLTADYISTAFFGQHPLLAIPKLKILPFRYYPYLIILAILLGCLGFLFEKILLASSGWFKNYQMIQELELWLPFVFVIPFGLWIPQVIGSGSSLISLVARSNFPAWLIFMYAICRFVGLLLAFSGNLPGGIFLPILALGALLGAAYGRCLNVFQLLPTMFIVVCLVVSMAGFFSSIVGAPVTGIILVCEMTGSFQNLMGIGTVVLISYVVAKVLNTQPLYHILRLRLTAKAKAKEATN